MIRSPMDLDALGRREGMSLRDLADAIPKECRVPDPLRSWGGMLRAMATIALLEFLLTLVPMRRDATLAWTLPATIALWVLLGWAMAGLFVIGHDCGHGAFSRNRWVNLIVGHFCMAPLWASYHAWRLGHNHHHVHTNIRKVDTNWPEKMADVEEYRRMAWRKRLEILFGFGSPGGLLIGNQVAMTRYFLLDRSYPQVGRLSPKDRRAMLLSDLLTVACTGGIVAGLWFFAGFWGVLKYYGVSFLIASLMGALFTLLHHLHPDAPVYDEADATPFRSQVVSTFDVRYPWIVEVLCFDINLHLVHHLNPRVPWYHLRKAGRALRERYPDCVQERPFRFGDLWGLWKRPLLRRDEEKRWYVPAALGDVDSLHESSL